MGLVVEGGLAEMTEDEVLEAAKVEPSIWCVCVWRGVHELYIEERKIRAQ